MTVPNAREYMAVRHKPAGVLRLVVLGDSMTFGHGVGPSETLPAQLERLLNSSLWDYNVEVVNCGQDGMSIYEMHSVLGIRGRSYHPDHMVLVLCENDAMMHGAAADYFARVRESWREDSPTFPYFGLCFAELARETSESGVPLTVAFYYQRDNDVRQRSLEVIAACCSRHGFDFVDLSAEFAGGVADRDWERYRVSLSDPHPSAYSHNLAARALARHLLVIRRLTGRPTLAEGELLVRCVAQTTDTIRAGGPWAWAIPRLALVLANKRDSRDRLALPAAQRLPNDERDQIGIAMEQLAGRSVRLLGWRALLHESEDRLAATSTALQSLDWHYQVLEKKILFVFECNLRDSSLRYQPYIDEQDEQIEEGSESRLAPLSEYLRGCLVTLRHAYAALRAPMPELDGPLAPVWSLLEAEREAVAAGLARLWDEVAELLAGYLRLTLRCQELLAIWGPDGTREELRRSLLGLATALAHLEPELIRWRELLLLAETRCLTLLPVVPCPRQTLVLVTVLSLDAGHEKYVIQLRVDARLPAVTLADEQHLIRDRQRHVYRFELPVIVLAGFHLWLERPDLEVLETVEIYSHSTASHVFQAAELATKDQKTFAVPRIFILA